MGNKLIIGTVVLVILLIGWARVASEPRDEAAGEAAAGSPDEIISANGIHWHPTLEIFIHGEPVEIPANVGLIGGHNPMHTHETDGVIHLEFDSVVRRDAIRLGRFFEIWGREFSEDRLFEHTNTDTERVRMFVNGEENFEFEDYVLQPEDQIEVRYE